MAKPNVLILRVKDYYQCSITRRALSEFEKYCLLRLREFVVERIQVLASQREIGSGHSRAGLHNWMWQWDLLKLQHRELNQIHRDQLQPFVADGDRAVNDLKELVELLPFKNPREFKNWTEKLTAYIKWSNGFAIALTYLAESEDDFSYLAADDDNDNQATLTIHYPIYFKKTCACIVDSIMLSYWT